MEVSSPQENSGPNIGVVGAGVAGLAAGVHLLEKGCQVRIFEASDRVGGWIKTTRVDGYQLEWGPNSFLPGSENLFRLVQAAGIDDSVVHASPRSRNRYLWHSGKLRALPGSLFQFLFSDALPLTTKVRMLAEPFISRGKFPNETVSKFFERRFGKSTSHYLADPLVAGITGGLPEDLEVSTVFPRLVEWEKNRGSVILGGLSAARGKKGKKNGPWSLTEGMDSLTEGLSEIPGMKIELNSPVEEVEEITSGWRFHFGNGTSRTHCDVDGVILAIPAKKLSALLRPVEKSTADLIGKTRYSSLALLQIGVESSVLKNFPHGFGFLSPRDEGIDALGAIWSSSLFPHRAPEGKSLLTVFLGGERFPELVDGSDDEIADRGLASLRAVLGEGIEPEMVQVERAREAIALYRPGHQERIGQVETLISRQQALEVAGDHLRGASAESCAASGVGAAERLLTSFGSLSSIDKEV